MRFLVLASLVLVLSACGDAFTPITTPTPRPPMTAVGTEARVSVDGLSSVHVAVDQEANSRLGVAMRANDQTGVNQLRAAGRVFILNVGTRVLVLDHPSFGVTEFRVLEGPHSGKVGLLPYEWVH